jgi:hypothetical protein
LIKINIGYQKSNGRIVVTAWAKSSDGIKK